MVIEMTSLQGILGRYYALASGESEAVGEAIFEHYLPRFAGDLLPKTCPGLAVGLADRLDTLAGLFAAGMAPTGARDPFAQRRAALGLVQALITQNVSFDLRRGLESAAALLPISIDSESLSACRGLSLSVCATCCLKPDIAMMWSMLSLPPKGSTLPAPISRSNSSPSG